MEISDQVRRGVLVMVKHLVKEGKRERVVAFKGHVVRIKGEGTNRMITVRQTIDKVDVERIIPIASLNLVSIEVLTEVKSQAKRARQALAKK